MCSPFHKILSVQAGALAFSLESQLSVPVSNLYVGGKVNFPSVYPVNTFRLK